jgi:hypothetical protein
MIPSRTRLCCVYCVLFHTRSLLLYSVPSCFILPRSYYQAAPGQILQFSLLMIPARTRLCCVHASNNSNPEQMTTRSTIIIYLECINVSQMNLSSLVCHTFTFMSRPITFCTFTRAVGCHLAVTFKNGLYVTRLTTIIIPCLL